MTSAGSRRSAISGDPAGTSRQALRSDRQFRAPQHLEGVRDAKVVVAIDVDPEARIFRRADYGIIGDLYEVIPALQAALAGDQSGKR